MSSRLAASWAGHRRASCRHVRVRDPLPSPATWCARTSSIQLVRQLISTPGHVARGENFGSLLANQRIGSDQLEAMLASLEGVFDPRGCTKARRGGSATGNGQVKLFEYEIDGRSVLRITPNADTAGEFVAEVVPYDVRVTRAKSAATSTGRRRSFFAAMSSAGETARSERRARGHLLGRGRLQHRPAAG